MSEQARVDPAISEFVSAVESSASAATTVLGPRLTSSRGVTDSGSRCPVTDSIAVVCFEPHEFLAGGKGAVMRRLPAAIKECMRRPDQRTMHIVPYHRHAKLLPDLEEVGTFNVLYAGVWVKVTILDREVNGVATYYLRPEDSSITGEPPFFAGKRDPYDMPAEWLARDAVFFGQAVVKALALLGPENHWHLLLQDWPAATTAFALQSQSELSGTLHLTLHNSYDKYVSDELLGSVEIDPKRLPGRTVLQRALPLIRSVFSVSQQFARELTSDLWQTEIMAPHLQHLLADVSIHPATNGPFKELAVDPAWVQSARNGDYSVLENWKAAQRQSALKALRSHKASDDQPIWGDAGEFMRGRGTWFVMAGRDDPRQKGYDVAALAIEQHLTTHADEVDGPQFLFFPIPGDEGLSGLRFLKGLARQFPKRVIVFPFRWDEGYSSALRGAAFALMPSLYEPFGMANEFYLDGGGCLAVARATGGHLEQVIPWRGCRAFSEAVEVRAERYHSVSAHPTGILFRERDGLPSAGDDWKKINECAYDAGGNSPNRLEERCQHAVVKEMAAELCLAIQDAAELAGQPDLHYRMAAEGIAYIQRTFSWERSAQTYAREIWAT